MTPPGGPLRIALCQMNATVGDIAGNERTIRQRLAKARAQEAQLVLFPELALTGYPPEDLLLKEHFLRDARAALERIAAETHGIVALVGFPERNDDVYNALAVLADGEIRRRSTASCGCRTTESSTSSATSSPAPAAR